MNLSYRPPPGGSDLQSTGGSASESTWEQGHDPLAHGAGIADLVQAHAVGPSHRQAALLAWELGAGEAEAITLARQTRASWFLVDDLRARRVAEVVYSLRVKGIVGLVVLAKQRGFITAVTPLLDQVRMNGYHLSRRLIDRGRRQAGEL